MYTTKPRKVEEEIANMKVGDLVHCMLECFSDYANAENYTKYCAYIAARDRLNEIFDKGLKS